MEQGLGADSPARHSLKFHLCKKKIFFLIHELYVLFIYFEMAQREDEEVCGVMKLLASGQFCMLLYS